MLSLYQFAVQVQGNQPCYRSTSLLFKYRATQRQSDLLFLLSFSVSGNYIATWKSEKACLLEDKEMDEVSDSGLLAKLN